MNTRGIYRSIYLYILVIAVLSLLRPPATLATPVEMAYTIAGSAHNWTLDFAFTNNMHYASCPGCDPPISQNAPGDMQLYRVGVLLPTRDIVSSPQGYDPDLHLSQTVNGTTYNTVWEYPFVPGFAGRLTPDMSLDGFLAHVTTEAAPLETAWFALGISSGGMYIGEGDNPHHLRIGTTHPVFQGFSQGSLLMSQTVQSTPVAPVPEPSTWLLLASGLMGLLAWRGRRAR